MEQKKKQTYRLCQISWCALALLLILRGTLRFYGISLQSFLKLQPPCLFHTFTGLYCPGCGGTRAVLALLKGRLLQSFWYHPIVPYTVLLYGWYLISNTIEWLSKGKFPIGSHYHRWYGIAAVGITLVSWIGKNLLYLFFQIPV